jgi:uncharacterized membrane protein YkvA (DUF1232 family)
MKLSERSRDFIARVSRELAFYRRVLGHPGTPRFSRFLLGCAIAYAVSPVDLVPDFIPIVGHLDDLVVLPLLIWLAMRLVPKNVIAECRAGK